MYLSTTECPDSNILVDYFSEELSQDERKKISEHICTCDKCIDFIRAQNYHFILTTLAKAHPLVGKKLRMLYNYSSFNCEAASSESKKVQELVSVDKKFKLVLRPSKDQVGDALLEIYTFDHFSGDINIFIDNKLLEKLELDDGYSFSFVSSSIDLTKIKLYYKR